MSEGRDAEREKLLEAYDTISEQRREIDLLKEQLSDAQSKLVGREEDEDERLGIALAERDEARRQEANQRKRAREAEAHLARVEKYHEEQNGLAGLAERDAELAELRDKLDKAQTVLGASRTLRRAGYTVVKREALDDADRERDRLREADARVREFFAGGPDTLISTVWHDGEEFIEMPLAAVRALLDGTEVADLPAALDGTDKKTWEDPVGDVRQAMDEAYAKGEGVIDFPDLSKPRSQATAPRTMTIFGVTGEVRQCGATEHPDLSRGQGHWWNDGSPNAEDYWCEGDGPDTSEEDS